MCIFVIPVTFAWHLNPPPHRCHAGRTGIRLAIYIGFKSQDQNFSSQNTLELNSRWHLRPVIAISDRRDTYSMLFRCHLDNRLRFNFHKDYCWNFLLAFSRWSWENAVKLPGRLTRPLHVMLWQWGVGRKWETACVRVDHVCVYICVIKIRLRSV